MELPIIQYPYCKISYNILKNRRSYTTSSTPNNNSPIPIMTISNLEDQNSISSKRELLRNKGGVYSFVNLINGKQYIGSAKDFYLRLNEHISNRKSNSALQSAIAKYGLHNFNFFIYEYFTYDSKIISHKALTDLENVYIQKFDFYRLYNFMKTATSLTGYKHTDSAKAKMVQRFEDKTNHPFFFFFLLYIKKKLNIIVNKQSF